MTETEIVIVGGGIAGSSAAFHLASHGRRVVLLERADIASAASGQNMGGIDSYGWGHTLTSRRTARPAASNSSRPCRPILAKTSSSGARAGSR